MERRVYVAEKEWREIRAFCAAKGISVSSWLRVMIGMTVSQPLEGFDFLVGSSGTSPSKNVPPLSKEKP